MNLLEGIQNTDFTTKLATFLEGVQSISDDYHKDTFLPNRPPQFHFQEGPKYIRVVRTSLGQTSVHCFIDRTNGNVLKAASWKAPDKKNPRGNIFDENNGLGMIEPYGVKYLGSWAKR